MDLLDQLNEQQRQAVTTGIGPVLVLAGPGSGKTRVLTQRIAYLIRKMGARPYQILAVTFTNKAARSMGSRVSELIGEDAPQQGLWLGTFHAMCARILRKEADHLAINSNFVIFDDNDQLRVVKAAMRALDINDKLYRPVSVHATISNAKNELILPEDYPLNTYRDEVVKRIYLHYQTTLQNSNAVDFDDLLLLTAHLLAEVTEVREKYAQRFKFILVDEFQDTNLAQYSLLKHLASVHHNIFVVGDPDQSIYRWRGADYHNVQRFEKDHPDTQIILLEQNYRSKQAILDAAMAVIDRNGQRRRKQLFTERGQGERLIYFEAADDYGEASFVVDTILQLVASKQFDASECAVMYRTNAQSRLLEEAFLQARLPYRLVGAQRFYGRREVKDIIAYLRLVYNPVDEISLERIINAPTRGIGEKTIQNLFTAARTANVPAASVLFDLTQADKSPFWSQFSARSASQLCGFGSNLSNWISLRDRYTITELFDRILEDIRYEDFIIADGSEEALERWENVKELRRLTTEYEERSLGEFLETVALISDQDTLVEGQNIATLLTLHSAKGLEFGAVFIVGLDDGILPHTRSFDEPEEMDEERRLFYVGITRAKDRLYLVRATRRGGRGYSEDTYPSRFLNDIPAEMLNGQGRGSLNQRARARLDMTWKPPFSPKPAIINEHQYPIGTRVNHNTWGEGTVLESRLQDEDEILAVNFKVFGLKRLGASLAKLTIIEKK
ncbi:MAG: UvrD-helicase domain-containing protein [Chloroflexota bacterium]